MPILDRYLPDLIDIVTAGHSTGRYGDSELDWTKATTVSAVPAKVEPLAQQERFDEARDVLATTFRVLTNQTGIGGYDRIVWPSGSGTTYEIMGAPATFTTPIGRADHTEVTMRLVVG